MDGIAGDGEETAAGEGAGEGRFREGDVGASNGGGDDVFYDGILLHFCGEIFPIGIGDEQAGVRRYGLCVCEAEGKKRCAEEKKSAFHGELGDVEGSMRLVMWMNFGLATVVNGGSLLDFSYGVLEGSRGNEEKAGEYFEKAYAGDPAAMPLVRRVAALRMEVGNRRGALEVYEGALEANPENPWLHLEYGDFLERVGRGDGLADQRRKEAYLHFLESMPGSYVAVERLIRFAREKGNDDRARELLEELVIDSSEAASYYAATSKSLYDEKDEGARKRIGDVFEKAIENHPEWADTARAASDHFREAGDNEKAIGILKRHVEVRPSSLDLRIRLGILFLSEKKFDDGVKELRDVLVIHPKKALAHESLAKHFRNEKNLDEARHHSAELLKIRGGSEDEFVKLAEEFMEAGKVREARLLLERAVFEYPEDAGLMMKLAMATARDPETKDDASRLFRAAENMLGNPADAEPGFLLESANEMLARGETKAAEERLRNAIKTFPKEAKKETAAAMRALAGIWISEGRNADAANALMKRADALEE